MDKNDSSSAIASLAMYGMADDETSDKSDGSDEETGHVDLEKKETSSTVDNISDEEEENVSRPPSRPLLEEEYHSGSSVPDKEPIKKALKRKRKSKSHDL